MGLLNKNIETALQSLEASDEDKKILQGILYKEHLNRERERDWESEAPKEISEIIHSHTAGGEVE